MTTKYGGDGGGWEEMMGDGKYGPAPGEGMWPTFVYASLVL